MNTDYNKQAKEFLDKTKATLEIVRATEQTPPLWAKKGEQHGIKYQCTLKNARSTYVFDFWDSIHNYEIINAIDKISRGNMFDTTESIRAKKFLESEGIPIGIMRISTERKEQRKKEFEPKECDVLSCLFAV